MKNENEGLFCQYMYEHEPRRKNGLLNQMVENMSTNPKPAVYIDTSTPQEKEK